MPSVDRFSVSIQTRGSFRPGEPIHISVDARSELAGMMEVELVLPEVELAKASSWNEGFSYRSNGRIPPAISRVRSHVSQDTRIREETTVIIPAAGLYRAIAVVKAGDTPDLLNRGRWVRNTAVAEVWLHIAETGGGVLMNYDPAVIPEGSAKNPGPFRAGVSPSPGQVPADLGMASMPPDLVTYVAKFYNADDSQYQAVPGAYFDIDACTTPATQFSCEPQDFQQLTSGDADATGKFYFECSGDEYQLNVSTYGGAAKYQVVGGGNAASGFFAADCGSTFEIVLPSTHSRVFLNMELAYDAYAAHFGETRSFIPIRLFLGDEDDRSYYDTDDDININANYDVWDDYGAFVIAHEYGHAFHEETLDGNEGGGCPSPHYINVESSLQCAFSEGFADYAGMVARPDLPYANALEIDYWFPGCKDDVDDNGDCIGDSSTEGSLMEGAFAAFLYDLTDAAVEAHDSVAAPGSYVADLIETCKVYYGSWLRADGTDQIAYCAENSVNPGSYFTPRASPPDSVTEAATEPGSWSAVRVHKMWTWNMYEKQ